MVRAPLTAPTYPRLKYLHQLFNTCKCSLSAVLQQTPIILAHVVMFLTHVSKFPTEQKHEQICLQLTHICSSHNTQVSQQITYFCHDRLNRHVTVTFTHVFIPDSFP